MSLVWSSTDIRNVALYSSFHLGISYARSHLVNRNSSAVSFLQCETPGWMLKNMTFHTMMDLTTTNSLSYASYSLFKLHGGFNRENCLLALSIIVTAAKIHAIIAQDSKKIAIACSITTALASITAYAFYKIDNTAGYLMLPFVLWNAFCTVPWAYRAFKGNIHPQLHPVTSTISQPNLLKAKKTEVKCEMEVQQEDGGKNAGTGAP